MILLFCFWKTRISLFPNRGLRPIRVLLMQQEGDTQEHANCDRASEGRGPAVAIAQLNIVGLFHQSHAFSFFIVEHFSLERNEMFFTLCVFLKKTTRIIIKSASYRSILM